MASSLVCRRVAATPFLKRLTSVASLRPVSAAPSEVRSFNTNTQMATFPDDDRSVDVDRRPERGVSRCLDFVPSFFSDVFDPNSPTRSVRQLLNMMDQFMASPFLASPRAGGAVGPRREWDVREDNDALFLRIDMPGIDKENVKVSVEGNTLIIKGEAERESEEEESRRRYSSRIELPPNLYKIDGITAELKNGVLKVNVPKVKDEVRKDVYQVKIE